MTKYIATPGYLLVFALCQAPLVGQSKTILRIQQDEKTRRIDVYRENGKEPILTQNALEDVRPYLHPIVAPDGKGLLTEYRPSHHPHQMGIFWGFKLVNGRDFFMQWDGDHYRRVSANVVRQKGQQVKWQTVYDMLDEQRNTVMTETQNWSMQEQSGKYMLDLEWRGEAKIDLTLGKYFVGGLFVRMPWREGMRGDAVNAVGQRNKEAEGQRAIWLDLGLQVEGRDDLAHIAIFDHPDNSEFPVQWRVDQQLGVGPDRSRTDWKLGAGKTEVIRYRVMAYTGDLDPVAMTRTWKEWVKEY